MTAEKSLGTMARRAHALQHVEFEGLAAIEDWLVDYDWRASVTRLFAGEQLPPPEEIDLLVIMGGPMSVNDEAELPWLADEKNFIRRVIELGRPVLGICLGAQLIASALGARVYANPVREIGWFPVQAVENPGVDMFVLPPEMVVFHWHGETFDLPPGAVHLAASEGCRHQAFQFGKRVIGLQFHLEVTPQSAAVLVENCRNELDGSTFVQDESQILAVDPARYAQINRLLGDILNYLRQNSSTGEPCAK